AWRTRWPPTTKPCAWHRACPMRWPTAPRSRRRWSGSRHPAAVKAAAPGSPARTARAKRARPAMPTARAARAKGRPGRMASRARRTRPGRTPASRRSRPRAKALSAGRRTRRWPGHSAKPCSVRWRRPRGNAARATTPADRSRRPPRSASVHRPTRPGCAACPTIPARSSGRVSATNTCAAARGSADMPDATAISCRVLLALALLLAVAWPAPAQADVRAWLDRDRIGAGETVTLNIETDSGGRPDYAPLEQDFRIEQRSSRQSYERHGGRAVSRTLFAAALLPRRDGVLTIPSLRVGAERTAPLTLTVAAAEPARARGAAWIEAELDDPSPYVQQA